MVWFSEDVLSTEMIFENYMLKLRNIPLEETEDDGLGNFTSKKASSEKDDDLSPTLQVCCLALCFCFVFHLLLNCLLPPSVTHCLCVL